MMISVVVLCSAGLAAAAAACGYRRADARAVSLAPSHRKLVADEFD